MQGNFSRVEAGRIVLEEDSGMRVVVVHGEHDLHTAPSLDQQLRGLLTDGASVIVDLTPATFVDSSILKVLLDARRQAAERGTGFAIMAGTGSAEGVQRVLDVTGLQSTLPVLSSRQDAVAAAQTGPSA